MHAADHVISTNDSYREIVLEPGRCRPGGCDRRPHRARSEPTPPHRRGYPACGALQRYLAAYLGVMGPQDGVDLVLELAEHVVHQLGRRDISFTLIGSGDCFNDLVALSDRLDLSDFVTFTGRIPDAEVCAILSTADVGISPDPKNPLNDLSTMNKTMEYMAFALPCRRLRSTRDPHLCRRGRSVRNPQRRDRAGAASC